MEKKPPRFHQSHLNLFYYYSRPFPSQQIPKTGAPACSLVRSLARVVPISHGASGGAQGNANARRKKIKFLALPCPALPCPDLALPACLPANYSTHPALLQLAAATAAACRPCTDDDGDKDKDNEQLRKRHHVVWVY